MSDTQIPYLRFAEFCTEWKRTKITNVLSSIDAGWSPNCLGRIATPDEWGVLKTTAVDWTGFYDYENKALPKHLDQREALETKPNDILVTRAGPANRVAVVAHVGATRAKLMISDKIIRLRVNNSTDSRFLSMVLTRPTSQSHFSARKSGLAESQANISQTIVKNTPISVPSLPEQKKIADFLGAVDGKLGALREKEAALTRFKRGLMQALFSQALRFTRDDGSPYPDWEEKRLGDVAEINPNTGRLPSKFNYIDLESVTGGRLGCTDVIDVFNAPSRAQRNLRKGDILFQMVRPYQRNNLLFDEDGVFVGSTGYAQVRAKDDIQFLYQWMHTDVFVNHVLVRCTGTSYPAINSTDLATVPTKIPHPEEQQKIADALSAMDAKISAVADQITHLTAFKKGLLQQMFV